ncbi:MAG: acetyl/propionyl/methylcrotonyl-CoA carboxylase subunit alpha [Pseudomonadota bacterium]|nr:acetyl/propionyl/methylcrotonyl-CoA carboxylase subunit alpha [Pseudomonadota bacterium]
MFDKILIANRGEIACRIAATARRMGIATVAVYSDADAGAAHVAACDEAWRLGPAPARESYLNIARLLEVLRESGAQAVHPGYGFMSENEEFARAVAEAGGVFVGPPVAAIAAMGSKSAAKRLMESAAVPLVPGYHGDEQDPAFLRERAAEIGYPVLIKASAGGGGKGMRIVEADADFEAALKSCRREAASAFGSEHVLVERYLRTPRHIEIQVFADSHGNCLHLFERDCSLQRRHQKVIEEAPAPGMDAKRRAAMGDAAVAAARAVGYVGAGTVEFIADTSGEFFFMEMNTRLQVEHPVTEMITGFDLVEWQLRVAAGEPLPVTQEMIGIDGHAIEARIYAENPRKQFLPSTGTLVHLRTPAAVGFSGQGTPALLATQRADRPEPVRIDSGVREGDTISPYYDPMIAKLIVWGSDRAEAIGRMRRALEGFEVVGPATNVEFLGRLMRHEDFVAGRVDTGLIGRDAGVLVPPVEPPPPRLLAIAAAALLAAEAASDTAPADAWIDPWSRRGGFRIATGRPRSILLETAGESYPVDIEQSRDAVTVRVGEAAFPLEALRYDPGERRLTGRLGEAAFSLGCFVDGERIQLFTAEGPVGFVASSPITHAGAETPDAGQLTAPMPGKLIAVMVAPGAKVRAGEPLAIMEAMKMEHTISAPIAGEVKQVFYAVGDQVDEGAQLIELAAT